MSSKQDSTQIVVGKIYIFIMLSCLYKLPCSGVFGYYICSALNESFMFCVFSVFSAAAGCKWLQTVKPARPAGLPPAG